MLDLLKENLLKNSDTVRVTLKISEECDEYRFYSKSPYKDLVTMENSEIFLNLVDKVILKDVKVNLKNITSVFSSTETLFEQLESCKKKLLDINQSGMAEYFSEKIFFNLKNEGCGTYLLKIKFITNSDLSDLTEATPEHLYAIKTYLKNKINDLVPLERAKIVAEIEQFKKDNPGSSNEELNQILSFIDENWPILIDKINSQTNINETISCWPLILGKNPFFTA